MWKSGKRRRIEVYGLNGARQRSLTAPRGTADQLDAAGRWGVFSTGRTIRALDIRSGRTSVLATAKAIPIGLSIEGRRVAWGEQKRIRAITLPGG